MSVQLSESRVVSEPSDPRERNNLSWRVGRLERDVAELQQGQPAVMAERVSHLSEDVVELRGDVKSLRRTFLGFLITFAFFGITIVVSLVTILGTGSTG